MSTHLPLSVPRKIVCGEYIVCITSEVFDTSIREYLADIFSLKLLHFDQNATDVFSEGPNQLAISQHYFS